MTARKNTRKAAASKNVNTQPLETLSEGVITGTIDGTLGDGTGVQVELSGTIENVSELVKEPGIVAEVKTEVNEEKTSDRGKTTKLIWDMMSSEKGTTREAILAKLQEMFPQKEVSALKNTVGALMFSLPRRYGYDVIKTSCDEKDKRRMHFRVEKKIEQQAEVKAA